MILYTSIYISNTGTHVCSSITGRDPSSLDTPTTQPDPIIIDKSV